MRYNLSKEERYQYASVLLLEEMINNKYTFPVMLNGDDTHLEPLFVLMLSKGLVDIKDNKYIPTLKGREKLELFLNKFAEFINIYDLFGSVDLEKGEFAFSKWFDFENDDDWNTYINNERFEDVRTAVCEFKGINPLEMIFLSFVASGDFDLGKKGWQFDLVSGLIWDEIVEICNNDIHKEQLEEQDAMIPIVEQGMALLQEMKAKQAELDAEDEELDEVINNPEYEEVEEEEVEEEEYVEIVEEVIYEDEYYDPYYDDIYYVSPIWIAPLFFI